MLLSALIPMIIMVITYAMKGIYPGGKFTIMISDMYKQYMPFYASLRYILNGKNGFFFSYFGALGSNFTGTYAYYLSNPFCWISVLFPLDKLPDFLYYSTIIHIGLTGLFFCIFLKGAFSEKKNPVFPIVFSCCYSLMSYNMIYSFNLMWLDVVMMLPLMILGIEKIINDKSGKLFVITLFISLLFNFYLTYMAGVFSFIYILYKLYFFDKKNKIKYIIKYLKCSFFSLGIMLPFLIPAVLSIMQGKTKEADNTVSAVSFLFHKIPDVFRQMLPCQYDTIETYGLPSVYCGSVALVFFAGSFVVKNVAVKQKILNCIVFVIYILSFIVYPLDLFWHGFQSPVFFPARYSFTFCFFVVSTAYYYSDAVLSSFIKAFKIKSSSISLIHTLVFSFSMIELFLNSGYVLSLLSTQSHYRLRSEYERYLCGIYPIINEINKDETFYRVSFDSPYSMCEGAWFLCNLHAGK